MRIVAALVIGLGATLCTIAAGFLYVDRVEKRDARFLLENRVFRNRPAGELVHRLDEKQLLYRSLVLGSAGAGCLGLGIGLMAATLCARSPRPSLVRE